MQWLTYYQNCVLTDYFCVLVFFISLNWIVSLSLYLSDCKDIWICDEEEKLSGCTDSPWNLMVWRKNRASSSFHQAQIKHGKGSQAQTKRGHSGAQIYEASTARQRAPLKERKPCTVISVRKPNAATDPQTKRGRIWAKPAQPQERKPSAAVFGLDRRSHKSANLSAARSLFIGITSKNIMYILM